MVVFSQSTVATAQRQWFAFYHGNTEGSQGSYLVWQLHLGVCRTHLVHLELEYLRL